MKGKALLMALAALLNGEEEPELGCLLDHEMPSGLLRG